MRLKTGVKEARKPAASLGSAGSRTFMPASATRSFVSHLNPFGLVRDLVRNHELLWQFTRRTFHQKHKGAYLGITWSVFSPLLLLGLYFIVFGRIFGGHFSGRADETNTDFALALLLGMTVFHFVADLITQAPAIIVGNPNLVKKVVFPVEVLPLANVGACLLNFAISLALVILGALIFGRGVPVTACWMPVIILPLVLLGAGVAWFLAALGVFFRDISQVTQFATVLLMYVSAVFFPSAKIRAIPRLWAVLRFNPLVHAIELLRNVMLWQEPPNLAQLGWLYGCALAAFVFGYACFATLRPSFSDVL